ncbi:erythromycin esterase family protein [Kamptonema formosum]|uniref:erythromycin esterase family protein n=1 Tax=Kamptonema formosum TaxID=331992 RepID=UPI000348A529|nr:erythromycin esterase family protein [Oscillatoria sp. PCC 10802]
MGDAGELKLGQLVRERYGRDAVSIGFTGCTGTVTAASDWGGPAGRKPVRPPLPGSYEALFHDTGLSRFPLTLRHTGSQDSDLRARVIEGLREPPLERAIGVIYFPRSERISHYFSARLPDQFDAIIHFDETRAVEPLDRTEHWEKGEVPETFPFSL